MAVAKTNCPVCHKVIAVPTGLLPDSQWPCLKCGEPLVLVRWKRVLPRVPVVNMAAQRNGPLADRGMGAKGTEMHILSRKWIGRIRRFPMMPFSCKWNAWVRDVTAKFG